MTYFFLLSSATYNVLPFVASVPHQYLVRDPVSELTVNRKRTRKGRSIGCREIGAPQHVISINSLALTDTREIGAPQRVISINSLPPTDTNHLGLYVIPKSYKQPKSAILKCPIADLTAVRD